MSRLTLQNLVDTLYTDFICGTDGFSPKDMKYYISTEKINRRELVSSVYKKLKETGGDGIAFDISRFGDYCKAYVGVRYPSYS